MKRLSIFVLGLAFIIATLTFSPFTSLVNAAEFKPSIVFDLGGKFDKSFNQSAYDGAERFKKDTGIKYQEFEVTNESQREQAINRMAERGGNPIVGLGYAQAPSIKKIAKRYPNLQFTIVDNVVDAANVQSLIFKEHEGSFLVGVVAALKSKSNVFGFVGGMDIPLIRKFACGYAQGINYIRSDNKVIVSMTGNDASAWNNPSRGAELARAQFEKKVEVVFAAAGGTGIGVYQAAKDQKKLAIGVDSNQNYLHPGVMLTSMVKRVDNAIYKAFKDGQEGTFTPGLKALGLAEGGVDWALDKYNRALISKEIEKKVKAVKKLIIEGKIVVHDYTITNSCPYF